MHPALTTLLRLRWGGASRRIGRNLKTFRGAFLFAFGLIMVSRWLGPVIYFSLGVEDASVLEPVARIREVVYGLAPLSLLAMTLFNATFSVDQKGIQFSPSEVDFLFSGPFTRRQLLAYKLLSTLPGLLLVAAMLSVFGRPFVGMWLSGFVAFLLVFMFMQLFATVFFLIGLTSDRLAFTRGRKIALGIVLALAALGLVQALLAVRPNDLSEALDVLTRFQESAAGTVVTAPFIVFVRAYSAETVFPDLVGWGTIALAMNLSLVVLVMWLDVNFIEGAAALSQKRYARWRKVREGGGIAAPIHQRHARLRLPMFPELGGTGPLLWRESTRAIRSSRSLLFIVLIVGIPMFIVGQGSSEGVAVSLGCVLLGGGVFLVMILPYGFRADLDRVDTLKSIPTRPLAVALGELGTPVLILTFIEVILLLILAAAQGVPWRWYPLPVAFIPLLNLVLLEVENFVFLLYPLRTAPATPGDFQFRAQSMLFFTIKFLILFACAIPLVGLGAAVFFLAGRSVVASAAALWIVLALEGAAGLFCVAWAFKRFDPSRDVLAF